MEQVFRIFYDIEMLSDNKSFKIGIWRSVENLWILNHLKNLKIKNHKILYQINHGFRQHKSTKHPIRRLRKKYTNTSDLLHYLFAKPYDILCFEMEFDNGWKMKGGTYIDMKFYTNSTSQRNQLIVKLFSIEGTNIEEEKLNTLEANYSYGINMHGGISQNHRDFKLPDEFWSEEEIEEWKKNYREKEMSKI